MFDLILDDRIVGLSSLLFSWEETVSLFKESCVLHLLYDQIQKIACVLFCGCES